MKKPPKATKAGRVRIIITCQLDERGNIVHRSFEAKSYNRGPVLNRSFMSTTGKPCIQLIGATFDLDRMRSEADGFTRKEVA